MNDDNPFLGLLQQVHAELSDALLLLYITLQEIQEKHLKDDPLVQEEVNDVLRQIRSIWKTVHQFKQEVPDEKNRET